MTWRSEPVWCCQFNSGISRTCRVCGRPLYPEVLSADAYLSQPVFPFTMADTSSVVKSLDVRDFERMCSLVSSNLSDFRPDENDPFSEKQARNPFIMKEPPLFAYEKDRPFFESYISLHAIKCGGGVYLISSDAPLMFQPPADKRTDLKKFVPDPQAKKALLIPCNCDACVAHIGDTLAGMADAIQACANALGWKHQLKLQFINNMDGFLTFTEEVTRTTEITQVVLLTRANCVFRLTGAPRPF